jgi:hypothetical protein
MFQQAILLDLTLSLIVANKIVDAIYFNSAKSVHSSVSLETGVAVHNSFLITNFLVWTSGLCPVSVSNLSKV